MASKRNTKFLDAQNFLFELRKKWETLNEEADRHKAENGKDTTYYIMLGQSSGLLDSIEMAEDFLAGKYTVQYD